MFVGPAKYACGSWDLRSDQTNYTSQCDENVQSNFNIHSADAVDIEQTRRNIYFFFACCVNTWVLYTLFPDGKNQTQLTKIFIFFLYFLVFTFFCKRKKVSSCHDGSAGIVVWYSVNSLHRVMFIPEYYSCFWMGNWLIFFIGFGKFFGIINHSGFLKVFMKIKWNEKSLFDCISNFEYTHRRRVKKIECNFRMDENFKVFFIVVVVIVVVKLCGMNGFEWKFISTINGYISTNFLCWTNNWSRKEQKPKSMEIQ